MKTVAICNTKGGAGKNTTCHFLATRLHRLKRSRVLVVGLDDQGTATRLISGKSSAKDTDNNLALNLFYDEKNVAPENYNDVHLIASTDSLKKRGLSRHDV